MLFCSLDLTSTLDLKLVWLKMKKKQTNMWLSFKMSQTAEERETLYPRNYVYIVLNCFPNYIVVARFKQ